MTRIGRPRLDPADARGSLLSIRLIDAERSKLEAAAGLDGYSSLSKWVRATLTRAADRALKTIPKPAPIPWSPGEMVEWTNAYGDTEWGRVLRVDALGRLWVEMLSIGGRERRKPVETWWPADDLHKLRSPATCKPEEP